MKKTDFTIRASITFFSGLLLKGFFPEVKYISSGLMIAGFVDLMNSIRGGAIKENNFNGKLWVLMEDEKTLRELKPYETIGIVNKIDGIASPFNPNYVFKVPDGCTVKILADGNIIISSVFTCIFDSSSTDKAGWHDASFAIKYPKWQGLLDKSNSF